MRALLDTHALLWWLAGDSKLSSAAKPVIADDLNTIYVSAASAWEISTKVRIGKLPGAVEVADNFARCLNTQGFSELPISVADGLRAGSMVGDLRDPFDRMLIAQALSESIPLITNEVIFESFGVRRLW